MHSRTERREDAHAPVADLVAKTLDDDCAVGGHRAGRGGLLVEEREQVPGSACVQQVLVLETCQGLLLGEPDELARGLADRLAELVRPADSLALPEGNGARHARSRRHEHAVPRDLLDSPCRRAEQERLAGARLVDHLLVELADAAPAVDEMHAEEPAVRDRSRIRDGEPPHAATAADDTRRAVPDDARPQLGELIGRITPGEHVEDVLELRTRQVGKRIGVTRERVQLVHGDLLVGCDRDDLLRKDVERIPRDHGFLDRALTHALGDDCSFQQVGSELREDAAAGDGAELVAGTAHALQPTRDRLGRLDLDDEVNCTHVDPELE